MTEEETEIDTVIAAVDVAVAEAAVHEGTDIDDNRSKEPSSFWMVSN